VLQGKLRVIGQYVESAFPPPTVANKQQNTEDVIRIFCDNDARWLKFGNYWYDYWTLGVIADTPACISGIALLAGSCCIIYLFYTFIRLLIVVLYSYIQYSSTI
jgi:hypothetical protein